MNLKITIQKIGAFLCAVMIVALPLFTVYAQTPVGGGAGQPVGGGSGQPVGGGSGQPVGGGAGNVDRIQNPIKSKTLQEFLSKILKVLMLLASMVVVFFIIYAGLQYVTARGDTKKIEAAHKTLWWTIVGAAILLGATTIARVIEGTVTELAK